MDDWKETTIGSQATLQRGFDITRAEQRVGTVPVVSSGGISSFHDRMMVKGPGVVLGRKGVVGSVYYIQNDYWPHDTTLWVKDFHGNDRRFVYYFFMYFSPRLSALDVGSANPTLNRNHVHPAKVLWPSISLQRGIADLLGALDDKIELNRRMNATLEAMARAIFKDWFVDFGPTRAKAEGRPPYLAPDLWALFPDALDDDDKPMGWEFKPVGQLVTFNPSESLSKGSETPYLDMAALPTQGSWPEPPIQRPFASGSKFRDGDTLLARITPCLENGKTAFLQCLGEGVVGWGSTEFIVLRPKQPFPLEFGYLFARDEGFRDRAIQSMTGTSGRQRVQTDSLASYEVSLPGEPVLHAFGNLVHPWFEMIRANAEQSQTLAGLRDLLLPKLMSGEIRLREAEQAVEAVA